MTDGVISLDEFSSSSNDGDSTESSTKSESESGDSLPDVVLQFEAGEDRIRKFKDQKSEDNFDSLVEFAEKLADDDGELQQAAEEYRAANDVHRIKQKYLLDYADENDVSFEDWAGAFYGDYDDPEEGTYNDVQQEARDIGANLFFYRVLHPTPDMEFFPSDQAVTWIEFKNNIGWGDGEQDTHIFVTRQFAESYEDFTIEVAGEDRPRPPTNEELAAMQSDGGGSSSSSGDSSLVIDPSELTVEELEEELQEKAPSVPGETSGIRQAERQDKDRKTAIQAISRYEKQHSGEPEADSSDESELSPARIAGQLLAEHDLDEDPELIAGMVDKGMTQDDIVEILG